MLNLWTLNEDGEAVKRSACEPLGHWLIVDDWTNGVIGHTNGTKEDARELYRQMQAMIPDDGNSWSLYERVGI